MFNKQLFDLSFQQSLEALAGAERITKETLKDISRTVLVAHHETQDIAYVNRIIGVLTPVNRKVAVLYFKAFTGFTYEDGEASFGKKSKKHYDACKKASDEFLAEPHNNIWSWAERNIDVEQKPLDLSKITVFIKSAMKKAEAQGIAQSDVLKAVFAAGVEVDAIIACLETLDGIEVNVQGE